MIGYLIFSVILFISYLCSSVLPKASLTTKPCGCLCLRGLDTLNLRIFSKLTLTNFGEIWVRVHVVNS